MKTEMHVRKVKLSDRAMAAVELMFRGVANMERVAVVVGLPIGEIQRLEAADDPLVRQQISEGLPEDFVFRLRSTINCPGCGSRIYLVPCVTCRTSRSKSA